MRVSEIECFFAGKRVFVTGHSGFKGGWLVTWLRSLGAEVIGYSLPVEAEDKGTTIWPDLGEGVVSIGGDVSDGASLLRAVQQHRPDVVFHLAAQSLVRRSYRDPARTFASNVMGTVNLLDAVRRTPSVGAVVVVTSDKCYENREWVWGYRETDALGGHDPYSASKGCAEVVTSSFVRSFFTDRAIIASARAGNVIGGGDWSEDRLVPDIIRSLRDEIPVGLRNPLSVRPWQHVLEPLRGYLMLAARLWDGSGDTVGGWNFGPAADDSFTVQELTSLMIEEWGGGEIAIVSNPDAAHEAAHLTLDCSKARSLLGWTPRLRHQAAIRLTVGWYREYCRDGVDPIELTRRQIQQYMSLLANSENSSMALDSDPSLATHLEHV